MTVGMIACFTTTLLRESFLSPPFLSVMLFLFVFFGSDNAALKLTELSASIAAGQTKKYVNIFFFYKKI